MRILHVVPSYLPATRYGGPIYSVHALCVALARRGHDVEVFTTNVDGPGVSDVPISTVVDLEGVKVTYFETSAGRRLYRSSTMDRELAARISSFDVVHLHSVFLWPTSAAARHARRLGVPYVLAPRGMLVADLIRRKSRVLKTLWIALFERRNLTRAAAVHVTSQVEADEIATLGLPMPRAAMIPNGVELPAEDELALMDDAAVAPEPFILSLGRINWKKGLDRLIEALVHVPGAHLVIAGNDEESYTPELEAIAQRLGLRDRIHFIGPVYGDAKWRLIKSAALFAAPSHNENFGNAVLEAMACAVPVVVSPGVGLSGAVQATGAGVVSPNDPQPLGAAIAALLSDAEGRKKMGARGQAAARRQFSWDAIAAQTEELYRAIAVVPERK